MQYWNGTTWVVLAVTANEGASLQMIGGVPTWTGGTPPSVTSLTGRVWMDRNLGATRVATSSTDAASYGDLYQWGRGADGHQIRTSASTSVLSSTDVPGNANFILAPNSPYDWRSGQNANLWQGVNGVNNPCPSGYRLPTQAEWENEGLNYSSWDAAGVFGSPLKLPMAGNRNDNNGLLSDVGSYGGYWSSSLVQGDFSGNFYFGNGFGGLGAATRARGFSVRCIKD
jgi:hypothetical protein